MVQTTLIMFHFEQDFSHLINGAPPNNLLQQALIGAQKRSSEQEGSLSSAFEPVPQLQQVGANVHEFYHLLEIFFTCVLKARGKVDVPRETIGTSNRIIWPPPPPPPPFPASSSSSQLPSPSISFPKKAISGSEESREQPEESVNQREFTTPALNSLIEMTLSKTYQLGNTNDSPKAKTCQKQVSGASMTGELGSGSGTSSRAPKRRKTRTTFTSFQLAELEVYFSKQKYLTPADRDQIAGELGLSSTQVITWFQNRRAKKKREHTELERDLLATKRSREKGHTFSFEATHPSQVLRHSTPAGAAAMAPAEGTVVPPQSSPSSSASLKEPSVLLSPLSKADFSVPSLTVSERPCPDPRPIWRPVCLEDIGRE
ncbi:Homeobox protein SMOX-5 [Echinococcus granulosus]|uniref:Homeobox protein SMOX-5 n=1 Tax=Echinococcus granulosus TaxID=6210 RepID=U6J5F1_ECHGR|nr:Homeobox protein SMOX-5 [Echinococcus granulosus]EUB63059.1 Homeobox protein SMOX-5 [Echinococcus granulosus]KAH9283353.1 Homeobox protein SMOX-5 [Echinococcus granulosus]CDS16922.1 ladybird [Echinococcus granulosus]